MENKNRLLIVDDNQVNRMVLRKIFSNEYDIMEVEDGSQCLELLRTESRTIAAVILDIIMPVMNGYEVLHRLRTDERTCFTPVVVVTSADSPDEELKALAAGADDFVPRPFSASVIRRRVANVLARYELDRIKVENAILKTRKAEEERYSAIINQMPNTAVFEWDSASGSFFKSESFRKYAVSTISANESHNLALLLSKFHKDDGDKVMMFIDGINSGKERNEAVVRMLTLDGEYLWTRMEGSCIKDSSGNVVRIIGTYTDVDNETKANLELEKANERVYSIIKNIPAGIAIYKITDIAMPVFVSNKTCEMLGLSREEYSETRKAGVPFAEIFGDAFSLDSIRSVCETGGRFEDVYQATRKDGTKFWLRIVATFVRDAKGSVVCYSTLMNVDEQIRQKQRQEWQNERYRILSEASNVLTFDYDPACDQITYAVSSKEDGMRESIVNDYLRDIDSNRVIKDTSKEGFRRNLSKAGKTPGEGSFDFQMNLDGGGFRWYRARFVSVADPRGKVYRVVGRVDDIHDEIEERTKLREKSQIDGVTGIMNRETAKGLVELFGAERHLPAADYLFLIDIDDFKRVNDTLGHLEGDRVLRLVASAIRHQFREGDVVGRYGGDEFIAYMRSVSDRAVAEEKAAELLGAFSELSGDDGTAISCSIGVAGICGGETFDEILKMADFAMYVSKKDGKGRYTFYCPEKMSSMLHDWGECGDE